MIVAASRIKKYCKKEKKWTLRRSSRKYFIAHDRSLFGFLVHCSSSRRS